MPSAKIAAASTKCRLTKKPDRIISVGLFYFKQSARRLLPGPIVFYLRLYDVLGLLTFRSLSNFELNFLSFS